MPTTIRNLTHRRGSRRSRASNHHDGGRALSGWAYPTTLFELGKLLFEVASIGTVYTECSIQR